MSYTCPTCGLTSYNPNDEAERYCGHCHKFESAEPYWIQDIRLAQRQIEQIRLDIQNGRAAQSGDASEVSDGKGA
jgi:hypothetical protein